MLATIFIGPQRTLEHLDCHVHTLSDVIRDKIDLWFPAMDEHS